MSLQLYRGPKLDMRYVKRAGSPLSVLLIVDGKCVMHATPSDFIALKAWWDNQGTALGEFMREPEDPTVAENMRGDQSS